MPENKEDNYGTGTFTAGADTWRVSNTGAKNRIYIRAAVADYDRPTIQYPLATAKEIHAALGQAIRELDPTYVGTPE